MNVLFREMAGEISGPDPPERWADAFIERALITGNIDFFKALVARKRQRGGGEGKGRPHLV